MRQIHTALSHQVLGGPEEPSLLLLISWDVITCSLVEVRVNFLEIAGNFCWTTRCHIPEYSTHQSSCLNSKQNIKICKIWGVYGGVYEERHRLGCDAVWLFYEPTFRRKSLGMWCSVALLWTDVSEERISALRKTSEVTSNSIISNWYWKTTVFWNAFTVMSIKNIPLDLVPCSTKPKKTSLIKGTPSLLVFFHPDYGSDTFFRNVGSNKSHTVSSRKTAPFRI
jgi:hypothetical protein